MSPFGFLCVVILLPIVPAFILFKALPATADVNGKLQGMEIKLGGAFGGYFALVLLVLANHATLIPPIQILPAFQAWTVTGQVVDENGTPIDPLSPENVTLEDPMPLSLPSPGRFTVMFNSSPAPGGATSYPVLAISRDKYQTVGYTLDPAVLKAQLGSKVSVTGNTIDIGKVMLMPAGTAAYPAYPTDLPVMTTH